MIYEWKTKPYSKGKSLEQEKISIYIDLQFISNDKEV